jgi:hypothetical protein
MIERLPEGGGKVPGFRMSGKLHDEDDKKFVPLVDAAVAGHGTVRILALAKIPYFNASQLNDAWA